MVLAFKIPSDGFAPVDENGLLGKSVRLGRDVIGYVISVVQTDDGVEVTCDIFGPVGLLGIL